MCLICALGASALLLAARRVGPGGRRAAAARGAGGGGSGAPLDHTRGGAGGCGCGGGEGRLMEATAAALGADGALSKAALAHWRRGGVLLVRGAAPLPPAALTRAALDAWNARCSDKRAYVYPHVRGVARCDAGELPSSRDVDLGRVVPLKLRGGVHYSWQALARRGNATEVGMVEALQHELTGQAGVRYDDPFPGWLSSALKATGTALATQATVEVFLAVSGLPLAGQAAAEILVDEPAAVAHTDPASAGLSLSTQVLGSKTWSLERAVERAEQESGMKDKRCATACGRHIEITVHPGDMLHFDPALWEHSTTITSVGLDGVALNFARMLHDCEGRGGGTACLPGRAGVGVPSLEAGLWT